MAQFTVYQNKHPQTKKSLPLLLDIQSNLLDDLSTTVVVPLAKFETNKSKRLTQLTPVLSIEGVNYLMLTPQLAGIARKDLGKSIASAESDRSEIIAALDFLISGV
jgi:toxin CcdB